jgi:hypothetical protein
MIEEALRETFAAKVTGGPPLDGARNLAVQRAELALWRAGRVRRRQAWGTALAGVLAVAIASLAIFQAVRNPIVHPSASGSVGQADANLVPSAAQTEGGEPADQSPTAAPTMPIEVVSGGEIYTEGKTEMRLPLPDKDKPAVISRAYRTTDGYLVIMARSNAVQQLLLLDKTGNSKVLLKSASSIAVSPGGDRVAWRAGDAMSVADRQPDKPALDAPLTIKAPLLSFPAAFLGTNVVLARSKAAGDGVDAFDLWYPDHVDGYTEQWDTTIVRTFGERADGSALYAQVRDGTDASKICIALLVPAQPFKVTAKTCGLPAPAVDGGGVSPDGRWLAYPVANATQVAMFDVKDLFSSAPKPRLWDLKADSARTVWLGPSSLVVDAGGTFVTLDPSQPTKAESAQGSSTGKVLIEPLSP